MVKVMSRVSKHKGLTIVGKTTSGQNVVEGQGCFKLVDTYGLPLEVIYDRLQEYNMCIDVVGYIEAALESKNFTYETVKSRLSEVFHDKEFFDRLNLIAELKSWK
jgi:alanyl-tRNA synthetase